MQQAHVGRREEVPAVEAQCPQPRQLCQGRQRCSESAVWVGVEGAAVEVRQRVGVEVAERRHQQRQRRQCLAAERRLEARDAAESSGGPAEADRAVAVVGTACGRVAEDVGAEEAVVAAVFAVDVRKAHDYLFERARPAPVMQSLASPGDRQKIIELHMHEPRYGVLAVAVPIKKAFLQLSIGVGGVVDCHVITQYISCPIK